MKNERVEPNTSIDEHGTLTIDLSGGASDEMLQKVFSAVTKRAEENLTRELGPDRAQKLLATERSSRERIRGSIEYRKYQAMPEVIRHPDGVLEVPAG